MKIPWSESYGRLAEPEWLWLLLLLPLLYWLRGKSGPGGAIVFSSIGLVRALGKQARGRWGRVQPFLRTFALVSLILALARPQAGKGTQEIESSGVDIVLVIDVSGSMIAHDFELNGEPVDRLTVVRKVVREFIEKRPNDRIGMVVFAEEPYLVSPLTLNHEWLLTNLERIQLGMIPQNGTAIGTSLAMAVNRLKSLESKSRIVVLLTDGDNNAGNIQPLSAAEAAATLGVKVYTIAMGAADRVRVPLTDRNGNILRDYFGRKQFTYANFPVDFATLEKMAAATEARAFRAGNVQELEDIYREIDRMEKTEVKLKLRTHYTDLYPWFVAAGLLWLCLEQILAQTRGQRIP